MDYVTIASTGNATDFGDLSAAKRDVAGISNSVRGLAMGGGTPSTINVIEYISIDSTGNATDYGDLVDTRRNGTGVGNGHGGLVGG
jgi:hypothetical protein